MPEITDPMDGLKNLQIAIDDGFGEFTKCELSPELVLHYDKPAGELRITYAKIINNKIVSYAVYVITESLNGLPCFSIGYAVPKVHRKKGYAKDILVKSIAELKNGFGRNGTERFYLEAIVGKDNLESQRLANKVISASPKACIDSISNKEALVYTCLIKA